MRRGIGLVITAITILIASVPALAKGPSSATITGPGIDEPIELFDQRQPEQVMHEHIVDLIEQTGLWYATPALERIDQPGGLGEPLVLAWGEGSHTIRQDIYLHAEGGPVIHIPQDQPALDGWGGEVTGWFRAPTELADTLQALGVPIDSVQTTAAIPSVLALLAALAFVFTAIRLVNSRLHPTISNT